MWRWHCLQCTLALIMIIFMLLCYEGYRLYTDSHHPPSLLGANGYYARHQVMDLPGQPPVEFRHYSGLISLLPHKGQKKLFYWFFEASSKASEKPLVLWLNGNGGPGCSSIGIGAVQEHGPFLMHRNGSLVLNMHAWNRDANMLYLESPVGVGFSYSNHSGDFYKLGDQVTAQDTYTFLINWLIKFPAFKSREFYIAGESYTGHYAPQLAELIWERNKEANSERRIINLKGFMIGNALLNKETDDKGMVDFAWSRGFISDRLRHSLSQCSLVRCRLSDKDAFLSAYSRISLLGLSAHECTSTSYTLEQQQQQGPDPCVGASVMNFFNQKDVQKALHASVNLSYPYMLCRLVTDFEWIEASNSVLPIMKKLLKAGLRIWVYSGDMDTRMPLTSTRYSINAMKLAVKEEWRMWQDRKGHLAGFVETYEGGLVLATIHGVGHQVSYFAPHRSLSLFHHFLSNKTLPYSSP